MIQIHCDGNCRTFGNMVDWLTLEGWTETLHFCSWNCLAKFASDKPWTEVV